MTSELPKKQLKTPKILRKYYQYESQIGEGSQGKTYRAIRTKDRKKVAIKEMKFNKMDNLKSFELFEREVEVLKSIHVSGVPEFYGAVREDSDDGALYLIQEYIPYPSLLDIINKNGKFNESETLRIIEAVARILNSLENDYNPPIIHRDIKPSNILCDLTGSTVKVSLIDFGAVANPQKRNGGSTVAGTFGYMAPEQMLGDVSVQSDYYALGATAVHMLTGVSPAAMPSDGFNRKYESFIVKNAPYIHKSTISLLNQMMATDPSHRPDSVSQILSRISSIRAEMLKNESVFRRLYNRFTGRLASTDGWIMGVKTFSDLKKRMLVYTFDVNKQSFIGAEFVDALSSQDRKDAIIRRKFPYRIQVLYDVNDPAVNCISGTIDINVK